MTITEALRRRIPRVRLPEWANATCYLRLPLLPNGMHGIVAHLFSRGEQTAIGVPTPQSFFLFQIDSIGEDRFEPYTGPLDEGDTAPLEGSAP